MNALGLRRHLGLAAVTAIVIGNMLGSGIFFTPGELAAVASRPWQVHFIWALCGVVTLCGALTLAELCVLLPEAGASYHVLRQAYGPLAGFWLVWLELWVSGPGAVAGIAIAFGEFVHRTTGGGVPAVWYGAAAIGFFAAVNLAGVQWGGRTQVLLTTAKVAGIAALVVGGLVLASPSAGAGGDSGGVAPDGLMGFLRFTGLGIAAVLFTYDGWIDVSHVAGEVRRPGRDLPIGLFVGVGAITVLYLAVNQAYLRVVPLEAMRAAPTTVATTLASAAFGAAGARVIDALLVISIFGALGGLVLTLPRLFYTLAAAQPPSGGLAAAFFGLLRRVSAGTAVPAGAIVFSAVTSIAALMFFGSFSRLVNFFVVPLQLANILMVGAIFRLRKRSSAGGPGYRTPGYPLTPVVYMVVMAGFLVSAIVARPVETLIGLALSVTAVPVYHRLADGGR